MPRDHYKPDEPETGPSVEDAYELDLEAGLPDPETAIRDAVAAVEARALGEEPTADAGGGDRDADERVRRLQLEVNDLRERSLRTLADFENYRRRVERERDQQRRHATAEVLGHFLEVVDNLERALSAPAGASDLRQGVGMIHRQMEDLLQRLGATPVPAVGERFDPSLHEAVAREVVASVEAPTVVEEYQRGYRLHERLLRPARVRVAVPAEPVPSETAPGDEAGGQG
jgi:molecular chaperone GrpE